MSRKIETLLRVLNEMAIFEKSSQIGSQRIGEHIADELTADELDYVAAARTEPMSPDGQTTDN